MQEVCAELKVPIFIAKVGIKLAQSWIVSLITPSKFLVLKVYLF